jgi:hypothetical protein
VTGSNGLALAVALEQSAHSVARLEAVKPVKAIYKPATAGAASLLMDHLDTEFPLIAAIEPQKHGEARLDAVLKILGIRLQKEDSPTDSPALVVSGKMLPLLGKTQVETRALFFKALAELFTHGADLRLEALKTRGIRMSSDLPVYAFQRQRFWIEEPRCHVEPPLLSSESEFTVDESETAERRDLVTFVERELAQLLRTDDVLEPTLSFLEVGGDSFIAMLLKKTVEQRYEVDLPMDALATDVPLETLYGRIADYILSYSPEVTGVAAE